MATGYRRILNHLTHHDPLWAVIGEKGYRPNHSKKFVKLNWCVVCGKATYRKSKLCSDRCFKLMIRQKSYSIEMALWHTGVIAKKGGV